MSIKAGMTVRTVKACAGLTREGAEDLAEGVKGTVLSLDGETALVARKDASPVYVQVAHLAGCKGRPLKAESLARALAEHREKAAGEAAAVA